MLSIARSTCCSKELKAGAAVLYLGEDIFLLVRIIACVHLQHCSKELKAGAAVLYLGEDIFLLVRIIACVHLQHALDFYAVATPKAFSVDDTLSRISIFHLRLF